MNVLVLVALGAFLFRPEGVVGSAIAKRLEIRRQRATIGLLWNELVLNKSTLGQRQR